MILGELSEQQRMVGRIADIVREGRRPDHRGSEERRGMLGRSDTEAAE